MPFSRRELLRASTLLAGATLLPSRGARASRSPRVAELPPSPSYTPFQADLFLPPVLSPVAPFPTDVETRPEWERFPTRYFHMVQRPGVTQIIPGLDTEVWGYEGLYPGPTLRARIGEPVVVRQTNLLDLETVVHLHGAHVLAVHDGFPTDFVEPGASRDYGYPNFPAGGDPTDSFSTAWYHDHTMDVAGETVYRGLAGFYLVTTQYEEELIARRRLPSPDFELPLLLQDRRLTADGKLFYHPFEHDGFLGDVMVVNGRAQPRVRVQRRKYRLRLLNGANARVFGLRLSHGSFLQIGTDSWLLPRAVTRSFVMLSPAERADVIVDFRNAPNEVFLEDVLVQIEGRGPEGKLDRPKQRRPGVPLLKFIVEGPTQPDDATLQPGDEVQPDNPIRADEIVATRRFAFDRRRGAWIINNKFFDPDRVDARPRLNTAERWILENRSGGWWHPVHIHLEAFEIQRLSGRRPPPEFAAKKDTVLLGPNDTAEVFIRFRDFPGRYVMHCHNLEHEDMRMMVRFDVVE